MFTLKKIWNILNHAGKPWQISLAISLAMIVGFTPFFSVHNVLIIFLVFILNIHLGMFLLASAFFSGIGYLFDGAFDSIGLSLLTNEALNPLWTLFYNSGFIKITNFNNSIVLGSLLISLILFFPMLKIVNYLLVKYREKIALKIKNIPILNKIGFFKEEEPKKVKVVRTLGFAFLFIVIGLFAIGKVFYFDSFIKSLLEDNITKNTDKIVQIKSLNSSILSSSLQINGLSISDKKDAKNNIVIDNILLDFELSKLLLKKLIVENIKMENIHFPNEVKVKTSTKQTPSPKSDDKSDSSFSKDDLKEITKLNKLNISDIKKVLNGDLKAKIKEYKSYYEKIKPLFNSGTKENEKNIVHTRDNGSWVKFEDTTNLPDMVVKNGVFTLAYEGETYNGKLKDFSTNQSVYNKPFTLSLGGSNEKVKNLKIRFSTFRTNKKDKDSFSLKCDSYKLDEQNYNKVSFTNISANIDLDLLILNSSKLSGKGIFTILNTDISIKSSNKYINRLNEHLKNTSEINIKTDTKGTLKNPKVSLDTNINEVLKSKIKSFVDVQKKELQKKLKKKAKNKAKKKFKKKVGSKIDDKLDSDTKKKIGNMLKF
ncbi:MAG: hypothetical protein CSA86_00530 [Arcobacter sp.]|nr:MAG: hypothetical protein CSA86_00530 [Arcobacter sp.]